MKQRISPGKKAASTDRWTEIIFRALSKRVAKRWRFVSFRGTGGGEWRGVVDLLAIRKDTSQPTDPLLKRGDLFEVVLIQMKGGSAPKPNRNDVRRLQRVAAHYHAERVVLFSWKKGAYAHFDVLDNSGGWARSTAKEIFG